jgi:hypothetical protein
MNLFVLKHLGKTKVLSEERRRSAESRAGSGRWVLTANRCHAKRLKTVNELEPKEKRRLGCGDMNNL